MSRVFVTIRGKRKGNCSKLFKNSSGQSNLVKHFLARGKRSIEIGEKRQKVE